MTATGLVNLVAELEHRLTGSARAARLDPAVAASIPHGQSVVLVMFDGLGADQARSDPRFARSLVATLEAPFPTTTTVSMSTVATGRAPIGHGVLGHTMWLPELGEVVNILKWVTRDGRHTGVDTADFLPEPNLWERLAQAGIEPITVQPAAFLDTPLSNALYRGCRFEGAWNLAEMIDATNALATEPGRFIFTYWPTVDVAAHVSGQGSPDHVRALDDAARLWERIDELPATVVGTADHGHIDYRESDKIIVRDKRLADLVLFGDPRAVMVRGDVGIARDVFAETGAEFVERGDFLPWFGVDDDPHHGLDARLPDLVVLAAEGTILLPPGFDRRLVGYHGGLDAREVEIPLLVH